MAETQLNIRRGTYYDSVVLMQLQAALARLPGVLDAGVVMGTPANKDLLAQSGLDAPELAQAVPDDLVIIVKAEDDALAAAALDQVDALLSRRQSTLPDEEYLPQSLDAAIRMLPDARWVLISVPGRYAATVARDALRLGRNVFLYSDNVSLEDEIQIKKSAAEKGLLVMGPDCGTAIVNGVGLGFANRVRRGRIGVVGASGTGLQAVTARIHQFGGGISHALGTGGRDLKEEVGAITAMQALDLLARDPQTEVVVLISKPPSPKVASRLLERAKASGKPIVVHFIGYTPEQTSDEVMYADSLDDAARKAMRLIGDTTLDLTQQTATYAPIPKFIEGQKYLRGLFSGGTLAYEALLLLQADVPCVYSNVPLDKRWTLENSLHSREHTIIDLGEDEFTVGRLHPMMDNTLRIQRMAQEAADPEVAVLLIDVVLGYGAHPDPASELAPAIKQAKYIAQRAGRKLYVIAVVIGTDQDPQNMAAQIDALKAAGAQVETSNEGAVRIAGAVVRVLGGVTPDQIQIDPITPLVSRVNDGRAIIQEHPVDLDVINTPLTAINVGLESFTESLKSQDAAALHVRWKPPAGGNERLMGILDRMKHGKS